MPLGLWVDYGLVEAGLLPVEALFELWASNRVKSSADAEEAASRRHRLPQARIVGGSGVGSCKWLGRADGPGLLCDLPLHRPVTESDSLYAVVAFSHGSRAPSLLQATRVRRARGLRAD